jgi:SP family sugar:H+ symporter-like MFS transporter
VKKQRKSKKMAGGVGIHVQAHNADSQPTEGSHAYAIIVCVFASLGGVFFGYDQGVTSGVLIMDSFLKSFCEGYGGNEFIDCKDNSNDLDNWLTFLTLYNVVYYIGCITGALVGGWVADKCGRRVTIFNAGLLFCIGTTWLCLTPDHSHTSALIARVIQGMGVGNSSFSLPLFGAEMAPKELRGLLSGFMQMTVVTGLLLANIVNLAFEKSTHGWRVTNGVVMAAPIIVMLGIFCVPESPRWTYHKRGKDAAEAELKRLRQTEKVHHELTAIGDAIAAEGAYVGWGELWEPSIRRRVFIAMFLQVLQQATGINPVFTYGGIIFKGISSNGILSVLILSIVNFVSTIPAMRWVDTSGRRKLLLIGAVGMCIGHVVSAITFTTGCDGDTDKPNCSSGAGYVMVIATSFFIFNFAISWGPICWIYPSEIFPLNARAKSVSLSTMANWGAGTLMMVVPKLFPLLNINGVFFLFTVLCASCGVFVYYMCPETKGLLLEDIEALFNKNAAHNYVVTSPGYVDGKTPVREAV